MNEKVVEIPALAQLPVAAAAVWDFAKDENILLFEGEMAAGKTTLIKEICRQAGVEEPVSSPTYALVNEYASNRGEVFYHFDFYRINDPREALDMGATEYFYSGNKCLIEWPSLVQDLLPEHFVTVTIAKGAGEARTITLKKY
ncbi:tRNA (adenosine(37)-N6)-threonylcarbamoyltransferase complex ATPase subunit type 1 TsaE [Adhaeribacter rhizoryzae]|uniref:tRNA threonylcarbamoyladenosine biosynthesis protein TsaE n=1 Tax=Adhaeribacter rhizoryzae TaxID=2607907 RepID=A0A5M6DPM0_9BACT|nr:tRNA (adenosine(37)-N6)-threonylcarbamoyltransferase complex ATPase subunit type 1 TsaE [Adhaeribacter rhizoryzae]KAA5548192.1 tRNA (adenosine(37)-N6)-threonylcarbamoyltransferase complex ATPase subunit type 1 TsaE [Adhaeribacter rhizoryzae]